MKTLLLLMAAAVFVLSGCGVPILRAAAAGNTAGIKAELDKGVDPNLVDRNATPLGKSVYVNNPDGVRLLLDRGANPNHFFAGTPPLHWAFHKGGMAMVELLLERGADPVVEWTTGDPANPQVSFLEMVMNPVYNSKPRIQDIRRMVKAAAAKRQREIAAEDAALNPTTTPAAASAAALPATAASVERERLTPSYNSSEARDDFAVVVGIENYPDLPAATFAERDAAAAKSFIRALGVPERNIVLLTGTRATKSGLEKTIEDWLPNNVSERSRVYFYYSGHGAPDPKSGSAYLLPSDGDPQYLARTGYPLKQLYFQLGQLKAKKVLVALDSCFSGSGGRSVVAKGTRPLVGKVDTAVQADGKVTVISASAGDQTSGANDEAGYGLFTYNLLMGLNGPAKDLQGRMTLNSLYNYLKPRVQDDARRGNRDQTPQLQGDGSWSLR